MADALFAHLVSRAGGDFMAQRLRHDDHMAQQHAGNDESRLALPAGRGLRPQHQRFVRRPPVGFDAGLRLGRQGAKPGQVTAQRQRSSQALRGQVGQGFGFVESRQRGLYLRRDWFGAGRLRLVARVLHGGQHVVQAFRHVQERGAEVALALRVVVDHHGNAALGWRRLLQMGQRRGFTRHGVDLRRNGLQGTTLGVARGDQHGVNHARQLAGRVVIGHIRQRQSVFALCPLRRVHGQCGQGLQYGHADALQLGLALGRVEHQRRINDEIGHAPRPGGRLHMRGLKKQVFLLARSVKGIGAQPALFERGNQCV